MTVYDFDHRQKTCPVCRQARLIHIVTAPNLWPVGDTVRYRCKDCATAEAEAGGDPLDVIRHCQRRHVPPAWKNDRKPDTPAHLKPFVKPKGEPAAPTSTIAAGKSRYSASGAKDDRISHPAPKPA